MTTEAPTESIRRLTRGSLELRGRTWWNRYSAEVTDAHTGTVTRCQLRMELGEFRSAAAAGAELDRYLAILQAEVLAPGPTITARKYFARFDRLAIALMRPESRRAYRGTVRRYLEPAFGAKPLTAIDAAALQELIADLHGRRLARSTIETLINRLRQILRHARRAGFSAHDIRRDQVKLPSAQEAPRERRHIAPEELRRILEGESEPLRALLWAVLGYAGLRIGEALGLRRQDVHLTAGVLLVRQAAVAGRIAPLKTRTATRDVPLLPELAALLEFHLASCPREPAGLLFATSTGHPLRSDDVRRRWLATLLRRLRIPRAGCHAFRHGLPGRLDALGLSPAAIQKFMGHASLAMTERYLHRSTSDLREQLAAALRRQPNPQPEAR